MSMFGANMGPSLADIAAVTGGNRNNDGGFGDGNGWWVLIILFAIFGGWGNGGYGNGGGSQGQYYTDAAVQRGFDTQAIISKLDGINNGICSLGYDQLNQMNGINSNIMQSAFGIQQSINADTVANMQNTNALSRQLSDCCCENRAAIAQVRYDMATDTCALKNEVHQTGDAIIQNQTQGFQMLNNTIRDGFCSLEMREMQRENQNLRDQLNDCSRDSALRAQSNYLVETLNPRSNPAYITCNPNTGMVWPMQMYLNGNGCGCGNGFNFNNGCGCNSCCA